MTKTVIYLDVDGVLNAVSGRKLPENTGWDTWNRPVINGYTITYSPELLKALHRIADRADVEIRWLTTWRDMAPSHICPGIGLNGQDWTVVADGEPGHGYVDISLFGYGEGKAAQYTHGWWKFDAIMENIIETKPESVIWIDDDLSVFHKQAVEILEPFESIDQWYLVMPRTDTGLTATDIGGILEFLDNPGR